MILLPDKIRVALLVNHARHLAAQRDDLPEPDPVPLLKLFNPCGSATWLASELDEDGDTLFGLADLGFGCSELGSFSLSEIAAVRLPFGSSASGFLNAASAVALGADRPQPRLHQAGGSSPASDRPLIKHPAANPAAQTLPSG